MSKYVEVETKFADPDCLEQALRNLGFKNVIRGSNIPLKAYNDEDRFLDGKQVVADIVVPKADVGSASNDLGFQLQKDGSYKMLISDYDIRHKPKIAPENVKKYYAEAVIEKYTKTLGFQMVSNQTQGKSKKIVVRRW